MTCEATPARLPRHALPHGKIGAARGAAALLNVILNPSLHSRVNSVKDLLFVFATEKSKQILRVAQDDMAAGRFTTNRPGSDPAKPVPICHTDPSYPCASRRSPAFVSAYWHSPSLSSYESILEFNLILFTLLPYESYNFHPRKRRTGRMA